MTGRETPQNDTDQQCEHCGLWFDRRGIAAHERNCSLKGSEHTIVPVDSGSTRPDDSPSTPSDGVGDGADPNADASGLGLGGPPDVDHGGEGSNDPSDDEQDDVTCPECDTPGDVDPDALDDGDEVVCTECGARLVWREGAAA
jgi:DNA-directed RNA polymerase subunit RPC12/RpoP